MDVLLITFQHCDSLALFPNVVTKNLVVLRAKWSSSEKRSNSVTWSPLQPIDHVFIISFFLNVIIFVELKFLWFSSESSRCDLTILITDRANSIENIKINIRSFFGLLPPSGIQERRERKKKRRRGGGFWHDAFRWEFYIVSYTPRDHQDCTRWRVYTGCVCVGFEAILLAAELCAVVYTRWNKLMQHKRFSHPVNSSSPTIDQFGSVSFPLSRKEGGRPLPLRHCVSVLLPSCFQKQNHIDRSFLFSWTRGGERKINKCVAGPRQCGHVISSERIRISWTFLPCALNVYTYWARNLIKSYWLLCFLCCVTAFWEYRWRHSVVVSCC